MNKEIIDLGFGVVIERTTNQATTIHNLKSNGEPVRNLGVRFLE